MAKTEYFGNGARAVRPTPAYQPTNALFQLGDPTTPMRRLVPPPPRERRESVTGHPSRADRLLRQF
jgi:hypothetical protein